MGLSVISQLATVVSTNSLPSAAESGSALPGDFATLLSGQTLAAIMSLGNGTSVDTKSLADGALGKGYRAGEKPAEDSVSLIDPAALIAMMGNPHLQPAGQTHSSIPDQQPIQNQSLTADIADVMRQTKGSELLPPANASAVATSDTKEKTVPGQALPAQPHPLGATSPSTTPPLTPAPSERPLPDAANIAARGDPGNTAPPAFSEALSHSLHHRAANPVPQPVEISVNAHLNTPAWPRQFSENVVWMSNNNVQSAQININPPQLGPVQITLSLSGDQATAIFASPHAEVRQAIESSMPQLKEMLAAAGISLGDTNVGANLAQQNPNTPFPTPNRTQSTLENAILPANDNAPGAGVATPLHQGRGLVDLFA